MHSPTAYWSAYFGLTPEEFEAPTLKIVPHAGLQHYRGAWLFRNGHSAVISVPEDWVERIRAALGSLAPAELTNEAYIAAFGDEAVRVIPPAYQAHLDPADFRPSSIPARRVTEADEEALRAFEAACDPEEWESGVMYEAETPRFGVFVDGQLVAAANLALWRPAVVSPGLLTHPEYRRRGFPTAALSAVSEFGLSLGHLMLYQTMMGNTGAVRAAEAVGYRRIATHQAVRLKPAE